MKKLILAAFAAFLLITPVLANAAATPDQQRADIQKMKAETLTHLYGVRPDTANEIANAEGFAVFDSGSLALLWVSGGYGHGVAHDNHTGKDTYMEMATAGVGLGVGVKDYNTIFVFHDSKVFNDFVNVGLDLSANGDLAAKLGTKGDAASGAANVLPGVNIYQLTKDGLMAQLMLQGTKYWTDDSLNSNHLSYNTPQAQRPQYNQ